MTHPLHRKNRLKTPTPTRLKITRTCRYCRIEFIPQSQRDFNIAVLNLSLNHSAISSVAKPTKKRFSDNYPKPQTSLSAASKSNLKTKDKHHDTTLFFRLASHSIAIVDSH